MEKKSKKSIVIGITGIFLVTLILLGLTYAYYRTRIIGNNSNEPSINVTSKTMEVTYRDGSAVLSTDGLIEPGFTAEKQFSVENTGSEVAKFSIIIDNVINEFNKGSKTRGTYYDWKYTIYNGTEKVESNIIKSADITFENTQAIIESASINKDETKQYLLVVEYKKLGDIDQSDDMGSKFSLRVNISDDLINTWENPQAGSLLYAIKRDNVVNNDNLRPSYPGESASVAGEKIFSSTEDDYGISYYYRGDIDNNYVEFNGMCWRIVRVDGNSDIKLVLASQTSCKEIDNQTSITAFIGTGEYGFIIENNKEYINYESTDANSMKYKFDEWLKNNLLNVIDKIELSSSCIGVTDTKYSINYGNRNTLLTEEVVNNWYSQQNGISLLGFNFYNSKQYNLKCIGSKTELSYINPLSIDELEFAGALLYETSSFKTSGYLYENVDNQDWLTATTLGGVYSGEYNNIYYQECADTAFGNKHCKNYAATNLRPSITLKSNVLIKDGGTGEKNTPYIIS